MCQFKQINKRIFCILKPVEDFRLFQLTFRFCTDLNHNRISLVLKYLSKKENSKCIYGLKQYQISYKIVLSRHIIKIVKLNLKNITFVKG